jgi:hypothetical protein
MNKQIEILERKLLTTNVKNKFALINKIKKLKEKERQQHWNRFLAQ